MIQLKSDTLHLSEDTKYLKETSTNFSSKLFQQEKHIYTIFTSLEAMFEKISVNNIVGGKIE